MARTGRPPKDGETKGAVVCVRFSASEIKALDADRGSSDRSAHIRKVVADARGARQR